MENLLLILSHHHVVMTNRDVIRNNVITYRLRKSYNNSLSNNFRKLKRTVVIFAKHHQRSKEKLTAQRKSILN